MIFLCLALGWIQDEAVARELQALSSDDIAVRERATAQLKQTPLEQLHLLEPALASSDGELRVRLREVMGAILSQALGRHVGRFSAQAVAPPEVLEQWKKTGHEPAKVPPGYERVKISPSLRAQVRENDLLKTDETLVENVSILGSEHVRKAEPSSVPTYVPGGWITSMDLTPEGARRLDEAADRLAHQEPQGRLALVVDGIVVLAPLIVSGRFEGHVRITTTFGKEEAHRIAAVVQGQWKGFACRVRAEAGAPATLEVAQGCIRETPGLADCMMEKTGERECTVRSTLDAQQVDLVALWRELRRRGYSLLSVP